MTERWTYPDGQWTERPVSPRSAEVSFTSLKRRRTRATGASGADPGSGSHWLIVAHQWAGRLDADTEATHLEGTKHVISSRKPGDQGWTTQQPGHTSARLRAIMVLEEVLADLRERSDGEFEDPIDEAALVGLLGDDAPATESMETAESTATSKGRTSSSVRPVDSVASRRRSTSRPSRVRRGARSRRVAAATPTLRSRRR